VFLQSTSGAEVGAAGAADAVEAGAGSAGAAGADEDFDFDLPECDLEVPSDDEGLR